MFYGEHGIAQHAVQGNRASSHIEGEVSWFFSSSGRNMGIFSSYSRDGPSKHVFIQQRQDSFLVARDTSRFSSRLGRLIGMPLDVRWRPSIPFLFPQGYWDSYQFSREVRHCILLKH